MGKQKQCIVAVFRFFHINVSYMLERKSPTQQFEQKTAKKEDSIDKNMGKKRVINQSEYKIRRTLSL